MTLPRASPAAGPVLPAERIVALDVLRGWALFGVLWSNLVEHYGTTKAVSSADFALEWIQYNLVSGRFYTLLTILFGIGFGIQLTRARARDATSITFHYRRAGVLLAIGAVHGLLIWHGDILTYYALAALMIGLFRDLRPRNLLIVAAVLALVVPEIPSRVAFVFDLKAQIPASPNATGDWILAHGDWFDIAAERARRYGRLLSGLSLGLIWDILMKFVIGLWAVQSGFLQRVVDNRRTALTLLAGCVVVFLISTWWRANAPTLMAGCGGWVSWDTVCFWRPRRAFLNLLSWGSEAESVAYATLLILALQTARGRQVLQPLAAVGRMGLTTYLTQSVISTILFFGFGFGLFGRVGYTGMFTITLLAYATQIVFSGWWLKSHKFGPMEWLWRRLTYGRAAMAAVANS